MESALDININATSTILNINIGILGHVDSGKTSLVRSLSTQLSTAALDKNPQSQQRGITLDLGFSAFTLPMPEHLKEITNNEYDYIQFTLVDCPGHASLIKTIIGGAQIIDMVLLVIDANKGIQTQTAECIVIGEITTDNMIIVLNKIDSIPEQDRSMKLEKVTNRIKKIFATTKFKDVPLIETSAMIGGEKSIANSSLNNTTSVIGTTVPIPVAAKSQNHHQLNNNTKNHHLVAGISTYGIDKLVDLIKSKVKIPNRNYSQPFYYSIDHCFSIKGHGTVLTGTVLSGTVNTSSIIEIPHLQIQRKVKSMQMFRKPVKSARQGDRVGICLTNLDAQLIERSIAAAPGTVPLLHSALCLVKKVRFFKYACKSMSKFHISVGHNTVIANVVFFGGSELSSFNQNLLTTAATTTTSSVTSLKQSALNACYHKGFPDINFKFSTTEKHGTNVSTGEKQQYGYEYQDEMLSTEGLIYGTEPLQWALLQFQHAVYCPLGSLIIGSRLDADTTTTTSADGSNSNNAAAHQCRLAFYGPIKAALNGDDSDLPQTGIYIWKTKICEIFRIQDVSKAGLCMEAIVWKLVTGNSNINLYLGLQVETECGKLGNIVSSFGADGKCRVKFSNGAILKVGSKLKFRYKKYIFDKNRTSLDQSGLLELRSTESHLYCNPDVNIINESIDNSYIINTNIKTTTLNKLKSSNSNIITKEISLDNKSNVNKTSSELNVNNNIKNVATNILDSITPDNIIPVISNKVNNITTEIENNVHTNNSSNNNNSSNSNNSSNTNNSSNSYNNNILNEIHVNNKSHDRILDHNNKVTNNNSDTTSNNTAVINRANNSSINNNVSVNNSSNNNNVNVNNNFNNNNIIPATLEHNIITAIATEAISPQTDCHNLITKPSQLVATTTTIELHDDMLLKYDIRKGVIESIKSDSNNNNNDNTMNTDYYVAIVKGAFRMEENIRNYIGAKVYYNPNTDTDTQSTAIVTTQISYSSNSSSSDPIETTRILPPQQQPNIIIGELIGPFGKLGKCKIHLIRNNIDIIVGQTIDIYTLK